MRNLNDLVPPDSDWLLTEAHAINEVGQIVGRGLAPSGFERGFLLTPADAAFCDAVPCGVNGDDVVDAADLALLLGAWGPNPVSSADLNGDGAVDAADLALLLGSWGICSSL